MSWQDAVNAFFEIGGGIAILHHCWTLYRDKQVRGASAIATGFMTLWGWWNLYYYPHLDQWLSFAGGLVIVIANSLWISLMIYYIRRERIAEARLDSQNAEITRKYEERRSRGSVPSSRMFCLR